MPPLTQRPPALADRPGGLQPTQWVRWIILLGCLCAGLTLAGVSQQTAQSSHAVTWMQIVRLAPAAPTAAVFGTPVVLPDSWKAHGLPPEGAGAYRLSFDLTEAAAADSVERPWSLRFDRLCAAHDIALNDRRLHSTLAVRAWWGEPAPELVDIPSGMLHAGPNALDIRLRCVLHGGLSMPALAPQADLESGYLKHLILTQYLPLGLNLGSMAFAAFVILLWCYRRQETATGLFGALYLLVSLRNCSYYFTGDLGLPATLSSWLYLCAHVGSAALLGWFALAISGRPRPLFNRLLWGAALGIPAVSMLTAWFDPNLSLTRALAQPLLQLLALPSIWILLGVSRRTPWHALLILSLGLLSVLVSGVHDFVWIRLLGRVDHSYWMPWTVPLTLPGFSMMLMTRVVRAFDEYEQINLTLEQKVQERTRELAAANAAKSHFLAAASHDLRQPVSAIGLITDLLHERLSDPSLRGLTDRLTRAVVSMDSLLKGLLDLSRLDSGAVEVHPQHLPLQPLLDSIAAHETESARHKGLTLRVRPTQATAWTDPILLEQILRNLVGNAVRHTERGGILVGIRPRGRDVLIQVWDTGAGISAADQARIFEEFVQLHNPGRERRRGLGLGLAIVKRAAQLMGYPLVVRSQVGRGSCFGVLVPTSPLPPEPTDAPSEAGCPPSGLHTPWVDREVLLIEDDQAVREALTHLLQGWGWRVTAGSGLRWLLQRSDHPWDLVISDHRLSDGTGRDVIQYLRGQRPDLPALIITGDTSPEQLHRLAHSGLPVLHKPFRAEKLRAMIDQTMTRSDDSVRKPEQGYQGLG